MVIYLLYNGSAVAYDGYIMIVQWLFCVYTLVIKSLDSALIVAG